MGLSLCLCAQSSTASLFRNCAPNHDLNLNSQLGQSSTVPEKFPGLPVPFVSKEVVSYRLVLALSAFGSPPAFPSFQATLVQPPLLLDSVEDSQTVRFATMKFFCWVATVNVPDTSDREAV